jgi:hypothetical protein
MADEIEDESTAAEQMPSGNKSAATRLLVRTHFRWGWWSLLFFLLLGIFLESMHGFKVAFYLDASSSTRRLMWTLAHAHGTLFALVNLVMAAFMQAHADWPRRSRAIASRALMSGSILLPAGFFFGGLWTYDGDPGVCIYLVPLGALLMLVAVFQAARSCSRFSIGS